MTWPILQAATRGVSTGRDPSVGSSPSDENPCSSRHRTCAIFCKRTALRRAEVPSEGPIEPRGWDDWELRVEESCRPPLSSLFSIVTPLTALSMRSFTPWISALCWNRTTYSSDKNPRLQDAHLKTTWLFTSNGSLTRTTTAKKNPSAKRSVYALATLMLTDKSDLSSSRVHRQVNNGRSPKASAWRAEYLGFQ